VGKEGSVTHNFGTKYWGNGGKKIKFIALGYLHVRKEPNQRGGANGLIKNPGEKEGLEKQGAIRLGGKNIRYGTRPEVRGHW